MLKFVKKDDYYVVLGIEKPSATIEIPAEYNGLPVKEIGYNAFRDDSTVTKIIIPSTITEIDFNALTVCSNLEEISVAEDNPNFKSIDGNLYSKDGTKLVQYAIGKKDETFIVPNEVTDISMGPFYKCRNLINVIFEEDSQLTHLGSWAFNGGESLVNVTFNNNLIEIGGCAFLGCTWLTHVTIPLSVKGIGFNAFKGCTSLQSVEFMNYVGWQVEIPRDPKEPKIKKINKKYLMDKVKSAKIVGKFSHAQWVNTLDLTKLKKF